MVYKNMLMKELTMISHWLSELILSSSHSVDIPDKNRPEIKEFLDLLDDLNLQYNSKVTSHLPTIFQIALTDPMNDYLFLQVLRSFIQADQFTYYTAMHKDLRRLTRGLNVLGIDYRLKGNRVIKNPIVQLIRETDFTIQCASRDYFFEILDQFQILELDVVISPGKYIRVANTDDVRALRQFLNDINYQLDVSLSSAAKFERLLNYFNIQYTIYFNQEAERANFKHKVETPADRIRKDRCRVEVLQNYKDVIDLARTLAKEGILVVIETRQGDNDYRVRQVPI
jgi:hypothetical protein